jgi:hypothetical protein
MNGDDDEHFTYIPPNAKKFYHRLLEYCLVADLEKMLSPEVDDNEEVSLGILSSAHIELINECALRWRIGQPYRVTAFLDLVRQFYERNEVPLECVPEAIQTATKVMQDTDLEKWPIADVSFYILVITVKINTIFCRPNILPVFMAPYSTSFYRAFIMLWTHFPTSKSPI